MKVPGRRGSSRSVAALDLPWLLLESERHPMHVAGLIVFEPPDGAPTTFVDQLCRHMSTFDAPSAPFDRRLRRSWGSRLWPRWEPWPTIRIEDHLRRWRLPEPGGEEELHHRVSALHRLPLDPARPLWEVHVIEGLASNRFAIYAKFHHSLVDGVGAIRILQAAFSADAAVRALPPIWAYPRARSGVRGRARTYDRVRAVPSALGAVVANLIGRHAARPYSAPASVLNTAISSARTVTTQSFDTARLQGLAEAIGGSANDAYLLVCSTALRRYLLGMDALPTRSLTAAMPVSVRPADGDVTGNAITFAFVSLATDVADDSRRAARIVASTSKAKTELTRLSKAVINTYTILTMAPLIVSQLVGLGAAAPPMFNIAVSNIPGPAEQRFYNGATVLEMYPVSLLQAGQALNITALSYDGRLNITFTACDALLPHIERLSAFCADALAHLETALSPSRNV